MLYGSGQRIRGRLAGHRDLAECLQLLPSWFLLEERVRKALPVIWSRLLTQPAFNADVIEDLRGPPGESLLGVGMSIALDERWQVRLRDDPPPCAAAEIYRELLDGLFVPPTDKELAVMNAEGRVAFLVLHYAQKLSDLQNPDTVNLLATAMNMFRVSHTGYRLQELYQEGVGPELEYLASMGFRPRTQRAGAADGCVIPELYGLAREEAQSLLPGSPVRDAFQFTPPVLGFSASERRLLRLAVTDLPDERIAEEIGLTGHTIKKLWRTIHQRVVMRLPDLYGDAASLVAMPDSATRGPEKRRVLIHYLRQHPEELRPYAA